jgi:hypothetical protein
MPTDIDRMRDRLLHEILPYRIKSVDTLHRAILWQAEWPNPTPMEVYADGNRLQRLEGRPLRPGSIARISRRDRRSAATTSR